MPNSLRAKISSLRYKGKITDEEYKDLISKLDGHDKAIMAIKSLEQTEPERKPGKWVHMVGWWECDQCHAEYTDMPTCMGKVIYEYCPMCGVKMEDEG